MGVIRSAAICTLCIVKSEMDLTEPHFGRRLVRKMSLSCNLSSVLDVFWGVPSPDRD